MLFENDEDIKKHFYENLLIQKIQKRKEEEKKPFIAPIFFGGIGNILFQIASTYTRAKDLNIRCIFGYFNHGLRHSTVSYEPWGNHPEEPKGLNLKHVFPNLEEEWMDESVGVVDVTKEEICYYDDTPHDEEILYLPDATSKRRYVKCYAFNSKYWYHRRDEILKGPLQFNPLIEEYVMKAYGKENFFERSSSVHLRLGYSEEPGKSLLKSRAFPPNSFFERAFKQEFFKTDRFIIFSDDPAKAKEFVFSFWREEEEDVVSSKNRSKFVFIENENVATSLYMMSRCKNHVLNSSTLSLWGAFLDTKQLTDKMGTTVYHSSLFVDHGEPTIPSELRKRWLCIRD